MINETPIPPKRWLTAAAKVFSGPWPNKSSAPMPRHATLIKQLDSHTQNRMKVKQGLEKKIFSGSMREESKRLIEDENECNFLYTYMKWTLKFLKWKSYYTREWIWEFSADLMKLSGGSSLPLSGIPFPQWWNSGAGLNRSELQTGKHVSILWGGLRMVWEARLNSF